MIYSRDKFEKQIDSTLAIPGFAFKPVTQAFMLVRKLSDRREEIIISYKDYSPHGFYISGISVCMFYNSIEEKLNRGFEKAAVRNPGGYVGTIQKTLIGVEGINYQKFEIEINDDTSFQLVAEEAQKLISQAALPFFEKFNNLDKIASFLSDKKAEEIVPYIQGPTLLLKTILILQEAGHPSFEAKKSEFNDILNEKAAQKDSYKAYLKVFKELFG